MKWVHLTNYWRSPIDSDFSRFDSDIGFKAIWVQAMIGGYDDRHNHRWSCCRGFGERRVKVDLDDLKRHSNGKWSLYYVNGTSGRDEDHYFYKFALIPAGTVDYGKRKCIGQRKWEFLGDFAVTSPDEWNRLEEKLEKRVNKEDRDCKEHFHIALHMKVVEATPGHS